MKLCSIIITHSRIKDAKVQIKLLQQSFDDIIIIHMYNGSVSPRKVKTTEDIFISYKNTGHVTGVLDGIKLGLEKAMYLQTDYTIISSADVWILKHEWLLQNLTTMADVKKIIGSSLWYFCGLSTEFFIIKTDAIKRLLFLLKFNYSSNFFRMIFNRKFLNNSLPFAEFLLLLDAIRLGLANIHLLHGREIISWFHKNRFYTKDYSYVSLHNWDDKTRKLCSMNPSFSAFLKQIQQ